MISGGEYKGVPLKKDKLKKFLDNKQPMHDSSTGIWFSRMRVTPKSTIFGIPF